MAANEALLDKVFGQVAPEVRLETVREAPTSADLSGPRRMLNFGGLILLGVAELVAGSEYPTLNPRPEIADGSLQGLELDIDTIDKRMKWFRDLITIKSGRDVIADVLRASRVVSSPVEIQRQEA